MLFAVAQSYEHFYGYLPLIYKCNLFYSMLQKGNFKKTKPSIYAIIKDLALLKNTQKYLLCFPKTIKLNASDKLRTQTHTMHNNCNKKKKKH